MRKWIGCAAGFSFLILFGVGSAAGQQSQGNGIVVVPPSNVEQPQDVGKRSHTNFLIFVRTKGGKPSPQSSSPTGEIPQSLSCVYQTWAGQVAGCPTSLSDYTNPVTGGSNVIAIVDAYDYPTACNDFNTFSGTFGLPTEPNKTGATNCVSQNAQNPVFNVVYANGSQPGGNCGWNQEAALDIEWAHAMAPEAKIILVEAASSSNSNLLTAVQVASNLVTAGGGGEVSMSWGSSEFSTESSYDGLYFSTPGVTYFASSGDNGGKVIWPSASANVISAGGTSVNRSGGLFTSETTWSSAGGGPSKYVPLPGYQGSVYSLAQILGNHRGTPDISFDANPYTGVSVYDTTSCQGYVNWMVFGGTSVASPSLAGIANYSGVFDGGWDSGTNKTSVVNNLYNNYSNASTGGTTTPYSSSFFDVTSGSAGTYPATPDWDFASGIGSPRGTNGFASGPPPSPSFTVSASPSSLTLTQGQTTGNSFTVTITPANGYMGTVDLSVSGCPNLATCSLAQSVTISSSSAVTTQLTIGTDTSTATGTATLAVTGTDSVQSSLSSSTSVSLTVNAPAPNGISLSASPTSFSVKQGSSGSSTITVTPSGSFTGMVSLIVTGCPTGANCSLSSSSVNITSTSPLAVTLTVSPTTSTPTGTSTVTVSGSGTGVSGSTGVSVTVTTAKHGKKGIR